MKPTACSAEATRATPRETRSEVDGDTPGRARSIPRCYSDFAAIAYICIRLKGRASRLRRQFLARSIREKLLLNEPLSASTDQLARIIDVGAQTGFDSVARVALLRRLLRCLTDRELALLHEIYWEQKRVNHLCKERRVSKNSVLKMKRNALTKLRRALRGLK